MAIQFDRAQLELIQLAARLLQHQLPHEPELLNARSELDGVVVWVEHQLTDLPESISDDQAVLPAAVDSDDATRVVVENAEYESDMAEAPLPSKVLKLGDASIAVEPSPIHIHQGQQMPSIGCIADDPPVALPVDVETFEPFDDPLHFDLENTAIGLRLKAEACQWTMDGGCDQQRMNDIISQASDLPDCFIWHQRFGAGIDTKRWAMLKQCYTNLATFIMLWAEVSEDIEAGKWKPLGDLLQFGASLQSALRRAIQEGPGESRSDTQQVSVYKWLRAVADLHGIHVKKHLRGDDLVDPLHAGQHAEKLARWTQSYRDLITHRCGKQVICKQKKELLNRITYNLKQERMTDHHWGVVLTTIAKWRSEGLYATDSDFIDLVLPVVEPLLRRISLIKNTQDREKVFIFLTGMLPEDSADIDDIGTAEEDKSLLEARVALNGRPLVMFGGTRNAAAERRIAKALDCDVRWHDDGKVKKKNKTTIERIVARTARRGGVVVMLRWRGHILGWNVKDACKAEGVPYAMVPAGYNPASIVRALLDRGQLSQQEAA